MDKLSYGLTIPILTVLMVLFIQPIIHRVQALGITNNDLLHSKPRLQQRLNSLMQSQKVHGLQVCILKNGKVVYNEAIGYSDPKRTIPLKVSDIIRIGSTTKVYTAAVILKLTEESQVDLDETISKWFPRFPNSKDISIRMLLAHRTGIPEVLSFPSLLVKGVMQPKSQWTISGILDFIINHGRKKFNQPDHQFEYSNTNYIILGSIAEKVTGKAISRLYQDYIFRPLGLSATVFLPVQPIPAGLISGCDHSLIPFPWGYENKPDNMAWASLASCSGAMAANAYELAWFMQSLMSGGIVNTESIKRMSDFSDITFEDHAEIDGAGLGLFRIKINGTVYWGHEGLMIGSQAIVLHSPEQHLTMAIVGNASEFDSLPFVEVFAELLTQKTDQSE